MNSWTTIINLISIYQRLRGFERQIPKETLVFANDYDDPRYMATETRARRRHAGGGAGVAQDALPPGAAAWWTAVLFPLQAACGRAKMLTTLPSGSRSSIERLPQWHGRGAAWRTSTGSGCQPRLHRIHIIDLELDDG